MAEMLFERGAASMRRGVGKNSRTKNNELRFSGALELKEGRNI